MDFCRILSMATLFILLLTSILWVSHLMLSVSHRTRKSEPCSSIRMNNRLPYSRRNSTFTKQSYNLKKNLRSGYKRSWKFCQWSAIHEHSRPSELEVANAHEYIFIQALKHCICSDNVLADFLTRSIEEVYLAATDQLGFKTTAFVADEYLELEREAQLKKRSSISAMKSNASSESLYSVSLDVIRTSPLRSISSTWRTGK